MGCSATSAVGVFAAVGEPLLEATALAMGVFGACGEKAAAASTGPGTFGPALIDALFHAASGDLAAPLRIATA